MCIRDRSDGNSYVVGDQYSTTPLSSAEITARFAALYRIARTVARCAETIFTGVAASYAASYTCIAPVGAAIAIFCWASPLR